MYILAKYDRISYNLIQLIGKLHLINRHTFEQRNPDMDLKVLEENRFS